MNSSDFILKGSKEYSLYVAQQRAIPCATDGLKTSQRMALWLLRNKADKIKTVGLGGLMASSGLYVHGDASANGAIGLLAAPYKNNIPLIEGIGSFGSRAQPDAIGQPRYTSVRRSKAAEMFLYNDLPLVPMEDNYDGSTQQPKHFLPLIPTVLLNGVIGVAVGFSTEILPRSLESLINATKAAVQGKKFAEPEPSFQNYNVGIQSAGPNQWELTGRVQIVNTSTLRVTELPPGLSLETFKKRLIAMEDDDKISNFVDGSSSSINVEIQLKRGAAKGWSADDAISFLKLREKVTERIVVVDWDGVRISTYQSASDFIKDFAKWRFGWYEKRYQRFLDEDSYELRYWKLLAALFKAGFTKRLGTFENKAAVEADVLSVGQKAKLEVDDHHVSRAVNLPTYRWTKEFEGEVLRTIKELEGKIAEHKAILSDPERRKQIFVDELDRLKKEKFN